MGDIVERLREQPTMSSFANIGDMVGRLNHEREEAADEIERLRSGRNACEEQFQAKVNQILGMMDEIERLRGALQGAKTIINLLCQGFDVEPENVVINVTSENEDGEEVFVKSISAQDVLTEIHAALGEKE